MNGRRQDMQHNTPAQVREYLTEALAIVAEINPPDDLRVTAFDKAVNLLSSKSIMQEQIAPGLAGVALPRL